ncbi:MAG: hypothetical protein AAF385_02410 [Pseudomonadota bacterium]
MRTTILAVCIGALLGASAMAVFSKLQGSKAELRTERAEAANSLLKQIENDAPEPTLPDVLLRSTNAGDRSMFVLVAAKADAKELEDLIYEAAEQTHGKARDFSLSTLFARYTELDAPAALTLANSLRVDNKHKAEIYGVWATHDTDAALSALGQLNNRSVASSAGLAMIESLGNHKLAFDSVAQAMPEGTNLNRLRADSLAQLAKSQPEAAFSQLQLESDNAYASSAFQKIAEQWGKTDPQAAMAAAQDIRNFNVRTSFKGKLYNEWAESDPDTVMSIVLNAHGSSSEDFAALGWAVRALAEAQPEQLLANADSLSPKLRMDARRSAFSTLAKRDPGNAVALYESMPAAFRRDRQAISSIAKTLGNEDPTLALEWAKTLPDSVKRSAGNLLGRLADEDPEQAINLALSVDDKRLRKALANNVVQTAVRTSDDPGRFIDRYLEAFPAAQRTYQLGGFLSVWADKDLDGALNWLRNSDQKVESYMMSQIASNLAKQDPQAAIAAIDRVAEKDRSTWLKSVAKNYARSDPDAALAWIRTLEGQPDYTQALGSAAQALVESDLQLALNTAEQVQNDTAAVRLAEAAIGKLASENPAAAVDWAIRQNSPAVREQSLRTAFQTWNSEDPGRALARARQLQAGQDKDAVITSLVQHQLWRAPEEFDTTIIGEVSGSFAQQRLAAMAAIRLTTKNKEQAERLLDEYIKDPSLLESTKRRMAANPWSD